MQIENVNVYDIDNCFKASKYPMSTNTDKCDTTITDTIKKLAQSQGGHDQFLTGIRVSFDLTFSNKAWCELERYRFIDFVSSQSTMHKISSFNLNQQYNEYVDTRIIDIMNELKDTYNTNPSPKNFLRLIYSNPSGFELTARLSTNYRCLKNVYQQRKNHRLPEWREFCKWIEKLPYAKELIINE